MSGRIPILGFFIIIAAGLFSIKTVAAPQANAVTPGEIWVAGTFEHLGVTWWIGDDDDLDSQMVLEYRPAGSPTWLPGAPAMRAHPTLIVNDDPLGLNYWAASALFLEPGQAYDLRLTLTDPDGGGGAQTVQGTTRTLPSPDPTGRLRYVIPGSGGGDGSAGNPFQGLQAAANAAQPGDILQVAAGTYSPFEMETSGTAGHPIVFQGAPGMASIIDGAGTDRGVVTLGHWDFVTSHLIFEGFTIQNGHWGIDAQNTQDIYLHHNLVQDVDFGIYNRRGNAWEKNQTVCDNTVVGRTTWPQYGVIPGERGIDLRGTGNVVCHNTVQYFGDCVSIQPSTGPSYGNDVFGNDAAFCVDDGIEVDYNQANVRVWRNRVTNARMGVSVQPIRGGPAYIFRNELFNLESVPIKMHNETTGFFVVHNTGAKHGDGYGDNGAYWRNTVLRNNLFLGTRYAFEFTTVSTDGFRDFDYNAWGTTRTIDPGGPFFKWENDRYDTIPDLPSGVEDHGVPAAFTDLQSAVLPANWDTGVTPGSQSLWLAAGAPEINAGETLPNFNVPFVFDGQPDLGAFENGQPLPVYGPRPRTPNFSASRKDASTPSPAIGEIVGYSILLQNSGLSLTDTLTLTDTLPMGLTYLPGSLSATAGTWEDSSAPTLTWAGTLSGSTPVTLVYSATVNTASAQIIENSAQLNAGTAGIFLLETVILANGDRYYLPIVLKQ